jgi:hypothetical protein
MKYLYCAFIILYPVLNFAQSTLAPYWGIAGGNLKGSFIDDTKDTYTSLNLDFRLGKILGKRWITGVGLSASTQINQNIRNPKRRFSSASTEISIFTQYHFLQKQNTTFYIAPSTLISKIYTTNEVISLSSSGNRLDYLQATLTLGNYYFLNSHIALQSSIAFHVLEETSSKNILPSREYGNLQLNIGLQFFINSYQADYQLPNKKDMAYALLAKSWLLEGNLQSENSLLESSKINVSTGLHYFLFNYFSLGSQFGGHYIYNTNEYYFLVKPSLRFYLPTKINYFYIELGAGANQEKIKINNNFRYRPMVFAEGQLGFGLFLSHNVALQGGFFYRYYTPWDNKPIIEDKFRGIGSNVGIQYFLWGNKR